MLGIGKVASGKLLIYDALKLSFRELSVKKRQDYEITELIDYQQFCGVKTMTEDDGIKELSVNELKKKIDNNEDFELIDVREPHEYDLCSIPNSTLIPLGELPEHINEFDKEKSMLSIVKWAVEVQKLLNFYWNMELLMSLI